MNPVQMSLLKKSGVWMFKTLSMMVAVIPPRIDVSSEHRDESKVITNIGRDGSKSRTKWSRRSRWVIKSQTRDQKQNMKHFMQKALKEQENLQKKRQEHPDVSKRGTPRKCSV